MNCKLFHCRHCGNLAALLQNAGVSICCCGKPMEELVPDTADASREKHRPVYSVDGHSVHVTVGAEAHPMTPEHWIPWICLESRNTLQFAELDATGQPCADFALCDGDTVEAVYAFCNQHELWRN